MSLGTQDRTLTVVCRRCHRKYQITVFSGKPESIIAAMMAANWALAGDTLVCPHCVRLGAECAPGTHEYAVAHAPWLAPEPGTAVVICTVCGKVASLDCGVVNGDWLELAEAIAQ